MAPNGTGQFGDFWMYRTSDVVTNWSKVGLGYDSVGDSWYLLADSKGTVSPSKLTLQAYNGQYTGAGTLNQLVLATSCNVGIGTTGPGAKLEVYNSAGNEVSRFNTPTGSMGWNSYAVGGNLKGYVQWNVNDTAGTVGTAMVVNNSQGKLHLWDSTVTGITISTGNVGIGSTTPGAKLDVVGDMRVRRGDKLVLDADDSADTYMMRNAGATTTSMFVDASEIVIFRKQIEVR